MSIIEDTGIQGSCLSVEENILKKSSKKANSGKKSSTGSNTNKQKKGSCPFVDHKK